jgi:TetR/AcrR family transcriptional regulator, repressor for uid operon
MRVIAEEAGLSRTLITYYFKDKPDLYRAVGAQAVTDAVANGLTKARCESGLAGKMTAFIAHLEAADADMPGSLSFLLRSHVDGQREEWIHDEFACSIGDLRQFLAEAVADSVSDGALPHTTVCADQAEPLLAIVFTALFQARGRSALASQLCRLLTDGLWALDANTTDGDPWVTHYDKTA